ncbi:MAG: hypothetical protein MZV63_26705 [Marinilabiliales bacterium]|nr:hypothetical protein [Marinilabiliales bacterium]
MIREEIEAAEGEVKIPERPRAGPQATINLYAAAEQHEKFVPAGHKPFLFKGFLKAIDTGWERSCQHFRMQAYSTFGFFRCY